MGQGVDSGLAGLPIKRVLKGKASCLLSPGISKPWERHCLPDREAPDVSTENTESKVNVVKQLIRGGSQKVRAINWRGSGKGASCSNVMNNATRHCYVPSISTAAQSSNRVEVQVFTLLCTQTKKITALNSETCWEGADGGGFG